MVKNEKSDVKWLLLAKVGLPVNPYYTAPTQPLCIFLSPNVSWKLHFWGLKNEVILDEKMWAGNENNREG